MDGDTRGVLYPVRLPSMHRLPAPAHVDALVRWFWVPEWDLPAGRVSRQELLPFPACNLVVEPGLVGLAGPATRRSFRDLTGRGWAVGALLRPAAVPAIVGDPARLRDGYEHVTAPGLQTAVTAAMTTMTDAGTDAAAGAVGTDDDAAGVARRAGAVTAFADWLRARVPEPDDEALLANALVALVDSDASVVRVEHAAQRLGVSTRTVQRLARRYVGLPPAALIRRRRLQEAAEALRTDPQTSIAQVAADLGYADQAHLTADFRAVLGFTPSRYRREAAP